MRSPKPIALQSLVFRKERPVRARAGVPERLSASAHQSATGNGIEVEGLKAHRVRKPPTANGSSAGRQVQGEVKNNEPPPSTGVHR